MVGALFRIWGMAFGSDGIILDMQVRVNGNYSEMSSLDHQSFLTFEHHNSRGEQSLKSIFSKHEVSVERRSPIPLYEGPLRDRFV